ncbi:uncharacterized protein LOC143218899 [Lasioglossum baleicum]|uniref:uncharacterized protein LOC143218899 n=1 Tax=Lasioglossum baleicum TaxID=434251 RepID=UPI003FCCAEC0
MTSKSATIDTFDSVFYRQQHECEYLTKFLTNLKKKGENNFTVLYLEQRMALLQETWANIKQQDGFLNACSKDDMDKWEHPYFKEATMDSATETYDDTWMYISTHLANLRPRLNAPLVENTTVPNSNKPVSQVNSVKLPKVDLPKFDGDYTKWKPFEARFNSGIIKNVTLSDDVGLQYLFSCLSGKALSAVEHLDVTENNFQIAWDRLKDTYDNERVIVGSLLKQLHSFSTIRSDSLESMQQFTLKFRNTLEALKKLGRGSAEDHLVYLLTSKFDSELNKDWYKLLGKTRVYPSYDTVEEFLVTKATAVELAGESPSKCENIGKTTGQARVKTSTHVVEETKAQFIPCVFCTAPHTIRDCMAFRKLNPRARFDFLKPRRVCINCLNQNHTVSLCKSTNVCRECGGKHHTLLHRGDKGSNGNNVRAVSNSASQINSNSARAPFVNNRSSPVKSDGTTDQSPGETSKNVALHSSDTVPNDGKTVLLATAIVKVYAPDGRTRLARALLDQGSQSSFVTMNLVQDLRLQKSRTPVSVTGLGGNNANSIDYSSHIRIGHSDGDKPIAATRAYIVRNISQYAPPRINVEKYHEFKHLTLADQDPTSNHRIDMLIGAELFGQILKPGLRRTRNAGPIAQNTVFGWILSGQASDANQNSPTILAHHTSINDDPLEKALCRFWESEAIPSCSLLTQEEKQCEKHFTDTYSRDDTGRFIVRLPFNKPKPSDFLGDTLRGAVSALTRLTNKLQNDINVKSEYTEFLREYESLGHMSRLGTVDRNCTYIPHRAVIRNESKTTKLRVVFNATNKSSSGYSLNDLLHVGPKLQLDITSILLNWRIHEYVMVADIEKMFRQILVHPADRHFQCILWMNEITDELEAYELNTITYGTACAPYLSMRVIRELNTLDGADYPLASPVLSNQVYVDDVFFGSPDKKLLEQTRVQLCTLLARGGFNLRKWAGNNPETLYNIPECEHSHAIDLRIFNESELKVLGIRWIPSEDAFYFSLQQFIPRTDRMTKRELLTEIAKLFDPLGWLSPLVVRAKILMQQQWLEQLGWDDQVSESTQNSWNAFCIDWRALNAMRIPRWIRYGPDCISLQLHGFSDASRAAFSCAIYARVTRISGVTYTTLLAAKTRVAPIKTLSIPILELNGANQFFAAEISMLSEGKSVNKHSPLLPLNPFIDTEGILRVGGRLQNSFLAWDTKHPIVLPKHIVSDLIITYTHRISLHGGTQITIHTVRQRFWILGIRNTTLYVQLGPLKNTPCKF